MDLTISRVQSHHPLPAIRDTINQAYRRAPWLTPDIRRISLGEIAAIIENPRMDLYFCSAPGGVHGAVLLDASAGFVEMASLAVAPHCQKIGIGPRLMAHVELETIRVWGRSEIFIQVVPFMQERLIDFYTRHGYRMTDDPPRPFHLPQFVKPGFRDQLQIYRMRKMLDLRPGPMPGLV